MGRERAGEGERERQGVGSFLSTKGNATVTSGFDRDGEVGRGRNREELQREDDGHFADNPLAPFSLLCFLF